MGTWQIPVDPLIKSVELNVVEAPGDSYEIYISTEYTEPDELGNTFSWKLESGGKYSLDTCAIAALHSGGYLQVFNGSATCHHNGNTDSAPSPTCQCIPAQSNRRTMLNVRAKCTGGSACSYLIRPKLKSYCEAGKFLRDGICMRCPRGEFSEAGATGHCEKCMIEGCRE